MTQSNAIQVLDQPVDMIIQEPIGNQNIGALRRRSIFDLTNDEVDRIKLVSNMYSISSFNSGGNQKEGDFFLMMVKGLELGINPLSAIDSINIIKGKPTLSAQGMLALVQSSGLMADYNVVETSDAKCVIEIQRRNQSKQTVTFTSEDADSLGLLTKDNYKKQKAIMLFWRCVTKALRQIFPDILLGLYNPEELEPDMTLVREDGSMEISTEVKILAGVEKPTLDADAIAKVVSWASKYGFDSAKQILDFIGQDNWVFSKGNGKTACEYIHNAHWNKLGEPVAELALSKGLIEKHDEILTFIGEDNWAFAKLDQQIAIDHLDAIAQELTKQPAPEPAIPTWTSSDKELLSSHLKKHYETSLDDVFTTISDEEFSHDLIVFANAGEAINTINQVAIAHNWAISTKTFRVVAKGTGGIVEVDSPVGTLSIFSRSKFADMLGADYQELHKLDIPNLTPGTYEAGHMMIQWKESGKTKNITAATAYDAYANIPI